MNAIVNNVGFLMDAGVLILLATTVALAFKLTISFRVFKDSRAEMTVLIATLSESVDACEQAVGSMQAAARKTSLELDELINDAKKMKNELQVMIVSGDALAGRLERLAEKNATSSPDFVAASIPVEDRILVTERFSTRHNFTIHDREEDDTKHEEAFATGLQSRAERELFKALQGSDHIRAAGRGGKSS